MFRSASQLQFGFIRFFFSPGLKGWYEFISFSRKFYVYESAILKIFKGNALVWTWLFTCFLCTMQETQTVSNLAVRTSVPHYLLKMSHLVSLAHNCHLLVGHQRNQVCAVKWLFIFFFLFSFNGRLLISISFLFILSIKRKKMMTKIIAPNFGIMLP